MKTRRQALSLILALVMALAVAAALLPASALAAGSGLTVTQVVPPKYDAANDLSEGLAAVRTGDWETGKWGFIDTTGREVVAPKYDYVEDFSDGLAVVRVGDWWAGKWGFIDTTGKEVVAPKYDAANSCSGGLAAVQLDGKWGFINAAGEEIVSCQYHHVDDFDHGLARVYQTSTRYGFIDTAGKEIVPSDRYGFDSLGGLAGDHNSAGTIPYWGFVEVKSDSFDGLWPVDLDGRYGFINAAGEEIIPCTYDAAEEFSEGLAAVRAGDWWTGKWGFIDKTGKEVVTPKYDAVEDFSEGMAAVQLDGKWGFIDKSGKEIVSPQYDYVEHFSDGLAGVQVSDKWGFINTAGEEVIPCKYASDGMGAMMYFFYEGFALVLDENEKMGMIDKTGREVIPCNKYDRVTRFSNGLAGVSVICNDWPMPYGFVDTAGREVTPAEYTGYTPACFSDGFAVVGWETDEMGEDGPIIKYGLISVSAAPVIVSTGNNPEASGTAVATPQTVLVDGVAVELQTYALTGNGGLTNYVRLRDLADILDGTAAQFNVTWSKKDGVGLQTGTPYTSRNGTEGVTNYTGNQAYQRGAATTNVDGVAVELQCFALRNGAYTYYKLRDLGQALGFNVGYSKAKGVFIETGKPYDPNN